MPLNCSTELLSITASKLFPPYVPQMGSFSLPAVRNTNGSDFRLSYSHFIINYLKKQKIISFDSLSFRYRVHYVGCCHRGVMQNFQFRKFLYVSNHKTLSFFFPNSSKYGKISENTWAQTVLYQSAEKTYPRLPFKQICPKDIGM